MSASELKNQRHCYLRKYDEEDNNPIHKAIQIEKIREKNKPIEICKNKSIAKQKDMSQSSMSEDEV